MIEQVRGHIYLSTAIGFSQRKLLERVKFAVKASNNTKTTMDLASVECGSL